MGNGSFTQIKSMTRIEARQNVQFGLRMHFQQNGPLYRKQNIYFFKSADVSY
jgi:hypothetical protein